MTAGLPRPFWYICAGIFVTRAGSFVLPFLALYLTQVLHLSLSHAGLAIGVYGAGGAAAGPVGGFLADRVGRRFTMVTALGLGGVTMIVLGTIHRLEVLVPGIFLVALLTEMYRPAMQAAVADLVAPADRVRAFGFVYWVINLGFAIGLTLGGIVASRSFLWLFVGDGLTTLVFASLIWIGVPETRPPLRAHGHEPSSSHPLGEFFAPFRNLPFVFFLFLSFLFAIVFMQNATTFPIDMTAHGISKAIYGRVLALNGIIIVLVQPFLGPFLTRRDRSRTLALGSVLVGIGFGINAVAHAVPLYVLGVATWTLGEMGVLPIANVVVADLAPSDKRGRYQGAYGFCFGLAVCIAPALGMHTLERFGSVGLWSACLVTGLTIAIGHLALAPAIARARCAAMKTPAVVATTP